MTPEELRSYLQQKTGVSISLTLTDNKVSMIQVNRYELPWKVRLHNVFLKASPEVIDAVVSFLRMRDGTRSKRIIRAYLKENRDAARPRCKPKSTRKTYLRPQGMYFDLEDVFNKLNREYFDGKINCPITFGNVRRKKRRRNIRYGSHEPNKNIIRINPALDRPEIPEYFVEYIVFHEMLHAYIGKYEKEGGKNIIHSREFRSKEKKYKNYERARRWEKANIRLFVAR